MITNQGSVLVTGEQEVTPSVDGAPVDPFAGVMLTDPTPGATDTVSIYIGTTQGTLTDGPGYSGLMTSYFATAGAPFQDYKYTLPTGSPTEVQAELDALVFTPSAYSVSMAPITDLELTVASSQPNNALVTDPNDPTTATDTKVQVIPDRSVSISSQVTYGNGVFTLTGTASSVAGVRSVEISAVVYGVRRDLGAATLNPDGTFVFKDVAGARQTSFVATETDGAGGQATSQDPGFNLMGGLGPKGHYGEEKSFSPTAEVSTAVYRPNGQRFLSLEAPGQAVDFSFNDIVAAHHEGGDTFVFTPGDGVDVLGGFKLGGADHDTLRLPSSEFRNFAAVLRDATYGDGYATITDSRTGEGVQLQGVTASALKAHSKDFAFG